MSTSRRDATRRSGFSVSLLSSWRIRCRSRRRILLRALSTACRQSSTKRRMINARQRRHDSIHWLSRDPGTVQMPDHNYFASLIWQIADLLRGPYRPPQYERVMLPMTVLRRFDCVLASSKSKVLAEYERRKGGKVQGAALDQRLDQGRWPAFPQPLPTRLREAQGRSRQHREAPRQLHQWLLKECARYLRVLRVRERNRADARGETSSTSSSRSSAMSTCTRTRCRTSRWGSSSRTSSGASTSWPTRPRADHFTPREVIRLMVSILFIEDDKLLATHGTVRKLLDPACGTGGHAGGGAELPA